MARKEPEPFRITSAARSRSDDIRSRQHRYWISMGIRTACFIAAVLSIGHWWMWALIVASFVLPYIAVVMANAGSSPERVGLQPFEHEDHKRIEGPPR